MHPATLHGVGVITKLCFAIFAAFKESVTLNLAQRSFKVLEGPPLKFGRAKKFPKFCAISDNFRILSPISPERIDMPKIGKVLDQLQPLPLWMKKNSKFWSTNEKNIGVHIDSPSGNFSGDYFGP